MPAEAGSAYIPVRPSLVGFHKAIQAELEKTLGPIIKKIGEQLGREIKGGFEDGFGDPLSGPLEESSKKQQKKAPKDGEAVGGAFAKGFQKRLEAAFKSLPKAEIDADSSEADKKIYALRARLDELSGTTVGVDIDSGRALAELESIRGELAGLGENAPIEVRADVAAALAELAAVQAEVDHLDGDTANIRVNANVAGAVAGLATVGLSLATVATGMAAVAAIPIGATVGAGILSLIGPLGAAGLGFAGLAAVAVPAFSNITKAQKAQQAAQAASTGTAAQAAAANKKLAATMAALTPAERALFKSWTSLRAAFTGWARELQPAVLPLFTRGINLVKSALPSLTPIVKGAAGAVNGLLGDVSRAAQSPFWKQLRTNITGLVPASITGFGKSAGNVATGLAGIVSAFLPYAPQILSFITRITAGFARWGQGLGTSSGFASFISYVKANLPLVLGTLTQLVTTVSHVVSSLAPLGPIALGGFGLLLKLVGGLKPGEIQAIAIAFTVLSAAVWAVNFAMNANPIVLVITGIVALVAAVILAYNHVGWFHTAVVAAWNGIKTAALFVWNSILKPVFTALVVAVKAVAAAATWLWKNVLGPVFAGIGLAARILIAVITVVFVAPFVIAFNLIKAVVLAWWHLVMEPTFAAVQAIVSAAWVVIHPILSAIGVAMRAVGAAATWLWRVAIVPAWNAIGAGISAVYNAVIRPVLAALNSVFRNVIAPVFRWIYNSVIKPVWSAVGTAIRAVWTGVISPAFNALKTGVNAVKTAFKTAVDGITKIWKGIESATKKPVQFVVNTVYNNGIRSVWNQIAGLVHLPQLPTVKFAQGGVLPGYTPGRDPHTFYSPTGGTVAMSGGEAIMRPEFTRAVGPGFVHQANKVARKRGSGGVRNWLANGDMKFAHGGIFPGGGGVQRFAFGGILDAVKHAGSLVVHGASSLLDGGASAFAKHLLDPILGRIPGGDSTFAKAIYSLPKRMVDGFLSFLKTQVDPKLGGDALGVVAQAKKFVGVGDDRGPNNNMWTRAWGMPGAPWCAMFVSDMIKRAGATKHYPGYPTAAVAGFNGRMRHVSTGSGQAGDLGVYGGGSHINIIAGRKGGAYDTYGGNQNALVQHGVRGGQTSVLRPSFAMGGILGQQAKRIFKYEAPRNADAHELQTPLVQLMRSLPSGQMGSVARAIVSKNLAVTNAGVYDDGGVIVPGLNLVANASRKPEAVLNSTQWDSLASSRAGGDTYRNEYHLTNKDITLAQLEALERRQETLRRVGRPH